MGTMRQFTITWNVEASHDGMQLREFLRIEKHISRSALSDIKFHGGGLLVNGLEKTVRYKLQEGDNVQVIFPQEEKSEHMLPEKMKLDIIHEDDHFIVVNKQAGIPTIPSRYHFSGSLAQGIFYYYKEQGINETIHIVNRLDRDTSGLVVIAKHRYAHSLLSIQQRNNEIKRSYLAVVHGQLAHKEGKITARIGRKEGSIIERGVTDDGQDAVTHYQLLKQYQDYALLSLELETGRTHQIRVHLSHIGHPLLGDDLYGGKRELISRQALHSHSAAFFHPFCEQERSFQALLPKDIAILL
jgi:23S rRNA pseudouridine1911/1915/1917 synthase